MSDAPVAFFSYSRDDSEFALRLAADLRAAGANVWIDQLDIGPGQRWDRSVQEALENCPTILIILSPASVKSDNVLDEVSFALDKQKSLIPILHRDCDIPFRVRRFQHLDFRTDYDRMLKELQKCLHLGGVPQTPQTAGSVPPSTRTSTQQNVRVEPSKPDTAKTQAPSSIPPTRIEPAAHEMQNGSSSFPAWAKFAIPLAVVLLAVIVYMVVNSGPSNGDKKQQINADGMDVAKGNPAGSVEVLRTALAHQQSSPPCALPSGKESNFSTADPAVWFFFAYKGGKPSDQWSVDWIAPSGYVQKTDMVAQAEAAGHYCFEMNIAGAPAEKGPGEWTVRLNRNGAEVARQSFSIVEPGVKRRSPIMR